MDGIFIILIDAVAVSLIFNLIVLKSSPAGDMTAEIPVLDERIT